MFNEILFDFSLNNFLGLKCSQNMQRSPLNEFVSDFSASKKCVIEICKYAASAIVGDGGWRRNIINTELAGELLDLGIDDDADYPVFKSAIEQRIPEAPEYSLLACAYAFTDSDDKGYWIEKWNSDNRMYEIVHKPNNTLDQIYDFLISLGYEMSDEERAMRDGTHQLLNRSGDLWGGTLWPTLSHKACSQKGG